MVDTYLIYRHENETLPKLSEGSLLTMCLNHQNKKEGLVLQVLKIQPIPKRPEHPDRFRLMFSDGKYCLSSIVLTTSSDIHLIENNLMDDFSIIKLNR